MSQLGRVRAGGGVHETVGGAIFLSVCFFSVCCVPEQRPVSPVVTASLWLLQSEGVDC